MKRREPGTNVLLYGPPGTGKTELAQTLAKHVKGRMFEVSTEDGDGEALGGGQRLQGYLLSQRVLSQAPDSLLLFDEIEDAFPWPDFFPFTPMRLTRHSWCVKRTLRREITFLSVDLYENSSVGRASVPASERRPGTAAPPTPAIFNFSLCP
jgi:hypothetical protein